jgi:hypothetical protein
VAACRCAAVPMGAGWMRGARGPLPPGFEPTHDRHWNGHVFTDHPGKSLIHSRAIDDAVQGLALTRNRLRTPPLWGLRTKNRLMHDGLSMTFNKAILRHGGEASFVVLNYRFLSSSQRDNLLTFLRSL